MSIAVLDIDGVVADVRHRLHFLDRRPKDWAGFFAAAGDDPPLATGIELAHELAAMHELVWLTGRPEQLRRVTSRWLDAHGLPSDELQMRPRSDHRPARVIKVSALRRLAGRGVAAFVDDDDEVVSAVLAAGFPAVHADWVPRDAPLRAAQDDLGRT
jgi:hypothetical protein